MDLCCSVGLPPPQGDCNVRHLLETDARLFGILLCCRSRVFLAAMRRMER